MDLNDRLTKIEGKHEGLDVYLPKLLHRFEAMELDVRSELKQVRELSEASRSQRWVGYLASFSIAVGLIAVAAAIFVAVQQGMR